MAKVRPITAAVTPIRKCPKCNLRTSLLRCPSVSCRGIQTVVEDTGIGRK